MKRSADDPGGGRGSQGGVPDDSSKRRSSRQKQGQETESSKSTHDFRTDQEYESDLEYLSEDELVVEEEINSHKVGDSPDQEQAKEHSDVSNSESTSPEGVNHGPDQPDTTISPAAAPDSGNEGLKDMDLSGSSEEASKNSPYPKIASSFGSQHTRSRASSS